MNWIWRRFVATPSAQTMKTTEAVIATLFTLGGAMVIADLLFGISFGISNGSAELAAGFVFWSLATAFVAFLFGGALGMLFGLPTARRVDQASAGSGQASGTQSGSGGQLSTGYVESTSLEQIADFLVKGIVALSLTTFDRWSAQFDTLSANVTATMLGTEVTADRVPGGLVLAGFALLGFLIGYLWMRRWFIAEMVSAQSDARTIIRDEQSRVATAVAEGRVGTGVSNAADSGAIQAASTDLAAKAVQSVDAAAVPAAQAIADATGQNADDPWKGAFGGCATAAGCVLTARITPLVSDPNNFQVDLLVDVADPARRAELSGKVAHYYLHPTFGPRPVDVTIDPNGKAPLQIFSYGGFTVGVLIDDGTKLELDLAQIPGAPPKFVAR